jgi:hypothetical protein
LLQIAKKSALIQADATYKLNYNNFPLLVTGTSDKARVFHPYGISLCTTEKAEDYFFLFDTLKNSLKALFNYDYAPAVLLSDTAEAIHNGFKSCFPSYSQWVTFFKFQKKSF